MTEKGGRVSCDAEVTRFVNSPSDYHAEANRPERAGRNGVLAVFGNFGRFDTWSARE